MELKKEQLRKILDDFIEAEGITEKLSDAAIALFIKFGEKRIWPNLPEQAQQSVNDWIDGTVDVIAFSDPGQGPLEKDKD